MAKKTTKKKAPKPRIPRKRQTIEEQADRLKPTSTTEITVANGDFQAIDRAPATPVRSPLGSGPDTIFSDELVDRIMERLALGETLMHICEDDDMPAQVTVQRWIRENRGGIRLKYAQAKAEQADYYAEEIIAIADDGRNDWMEKQTSRGVIRVVDHEHVQRSKLRIDARKWAAEKNNPRRYGDKTHVELEGTIGVEPKQPAVDYSKLSDAELQQLNALLNKAKPQQSIE